MSYSNDLAEFAPSASAGAIIQVNSYTFTTSIDISSVDADAYYWITNTLKGGSTDYVTFDNAIKSGNKCLLHFSATCSSEDISIDYCRFYIREGTATTNGHDTGGNVSGQPTHGLANMISSYTAASQYGENNQISFQHMWAPSTTTPNISIVVNARSYDGSTSGIIYIGKSGYNHSLTDVTGYQITIMEIAA